MKTEQIVQSLFKVLTVFFTSPKHLFKSHNNLLELKRTYDIFLLCETAGLICHLIYNMPQTFHRTLCLHNPVMTSLAVSSY